MRFGILYTGMPFHLKVGKYPFRWLDLPRVIKYMKKDSFIIDGFEYAPYYGIVYINEYNKWKKQYLPPYGIRDKVVLDIGAGCGETARFYLDNGARKVICIECNDNAYNYLYKNSLKDNRIIPLHKYAEIKDLFDIEHDFMKMDIEGCEVYFIDDICKRYNKPCVLEGHGSHVINSYIKGGFNAVGFEDEYRQIQILQRF